MPTAILNRLSFAAYGAGSGLITNGIAYFLLLYYSQVIRLDPALTGLALLIAMVVDAVSDPLMGRWSDRLQSRLGRRHPFLYAAFVPAALTYYLIWVPPELSQMGLFVWLLLFSIAMRLSLTCFSVPFLALLPELTQDYDERTRLVSYSYASGWFVGTVMAVAMYWWWLADPAGSPEGTGILLRGGYVEAAMVTGAAVCLCFGFAAAGTHGRITELAVPSQNASSVTRAVFETWQTLGNRDLLAVLASGVFAAAAGGTGSALWAYMQPWFWGFDSNQISLLLAAQLASPILAMMLLPLVSLTAAKQRAQVLVSLVALAVGTGPVVLALSGWFPARETALLFPLMLIIGVIQVALTVLGSSITASMVADVVEARAVETRRREEGLLSAMVSFTNKIAGGMGVWAGGVLLAVIEFPTGASEMVSDEVTRRLGWVYGPTLALFYAAAIVALYWYRLDRRTHENNLAMLRHEEAQ